MASRLTALPIIFALWLVPAGAQETAEMPDGGQASAPVSTPAATRPTPRPDGARKTAPDAPIPEPAAPPEPEDDDQADGPDTPRASAKAEAEPSGPPAWQAYAEDEFSYQSCLLGLSMLGVGYEELPPVTAESDRDCGMARPLQITQILPGVGIAGGAPMRCDTARQLALWLRHEAQPAVRKLPRAPRITEIIPGSTYQCRDRVGGSSEKLSEHALGNAFDVAGLRLSDGTEMLIAPRNDTGEMDEAVQKAMRHGACLYFTTVLGPGSNAAHDDHLHFDIAARNGGWRLCE